MRPRVSEDDGFTIVEAVVAALILTVGLLTTFMMLDASTHASADVRAREGAVTLARQITEDAHTIPYSQISGSTIVGTLQAMPGLASTTTGSTWQIARNGVTYTITVSVTPITDSKDASGAVDLQQIAATVSWSTFQGKAHQYTETTTVSKAGQDPGLIASGLALNQAEQGYAGISCPATPTPCTAPVVTSTGITSLQFQVNAPAGTTAITWSLNGGKQASWAGSAPTGGGPWISAPWSLSGLSDGTYTVGAQAEDANGVDGPAVTIKVRLIRNVPSAPRITGDGFNSNFMVGATATTVAEVQWSSNPELNVVGYRVYGPESSTQPICTTSITSFSSNCGPNAWCSSPTACVDLNGGSYVSSSSPSYTVKALYYDANNTLQEGNPTTVTLATGPPTPPPPIALVNLAVVTQPDNTAVITWTPPTGGTPVSFYRIYRDGDSYTNRYDILPASSCSATCTYHDTNRTSTHSYYITAVGGTTPGADMAESAATGPVTG
jgi:Tfp pilus assembly protein PilV